MQSALTYADAAWLHMEHPTNLMMVTGLMEFDTEPDVERLRTGLETRLLSYERFQMKVVEPATGLGKPRWVRDEDFDIANHLKIEELPGAGRDEVLARAAELMSLALDRSRPLWEMRLFLGLREGAALVIRLHHAIGDGIALMRVLLNLADRARHPETELPPEAKRNEPSETTFQQAKKFASFLLHEGHDLMFHPSHAGRVAQMGLKAGRSLMRLLTLPPDRDNAFRGSLRAKKTAAVSAPLKLEEIKSTGKRLGCTINDVLMGALTGALRQALLRSQQLDPDFCVRAVVPVDLRGEKVEGLGNRFGMVFLTLPVGLEEPALQLAQVRRHMLELKDSAEAVVAFELLSAAGSLPAEIEKDVIRWFGDKASLVVTNLPGPRETLYLAGARLESLMYWVPQSGRLALGISMLSYDGKVHLGVTSDAHVIPEPQTLIEDFEQALERLTTLEAL